MCSSSAQDLPEHRPDYFLQSMELRLLSSRAIVARRRPRVHTLSISEQWKSCGMQVWNTPASHSLPHRVTSHTVSFCGAWSARNLQGLGPGETIHLARVIMNWRAL